MGSALPETRLTTGALATIFYPLQPTMTSLAASQSYMLDDWLRAIDLLDARFARIQRSALRWMIGSAPSTSSMLASLASGGRRFAGRLAPHYQSLCPSPIKRRRDPFDLW
jgi:hypothetical protein